MKKYELDSNDTFVKAKDLLFFFKTRLRKKNSTELSTHKLVTFFQFIPLYINSLPPPPYVFAYLISLVPLMLLKWEDYAEFIKESIFPPS